jgi:phage shock protein C
VNNDAPGGGKGTDLRPVYVVIGVVLIVIGIALLGGLPIFGWTAPWGIAREITREIRRIGWPLAVIALGILVIVYSRRPGAKLPSKDARLVRSREKKVLAGVLGGLSDYFSVDVTLLRVGYVLLALVLDAWGPLLIAYIVAAIIVPEAPKEASSATSGQDEDRPPPASPPLAPPPAPPVEPQPTDPAAPAGDDTDSGPGA